MDAGHTVILIEHHLDVIKTADHVIDLGPEGGHAGGEVVATGTPETIAACKESHTGRFLKGASCALTSAVRSRLSPQGSVQRTVRTGEALTVPLEPSLHPTQREA